MAVAAGKRREGCKEIVKKYDDNNGVSCVTVAKGSGLEMLKMVFNKEFGKEFMKGVTYFQDQRDYMFSLKYYTEYK